MCYYLNVQFQGQRVNKFSPRTFQKEFSTFLADPYPSDGSNRTVHLTGVCGKTCSSVK